MPRAPLISILGVLAGPIRREAISIDERAIGIAVCLCLAVGVVGCYEIPPEIPDDYLGSPPSAEGWPPLPVYSLDPFDPANRWFQRAYAVRPPGGDLGRLRASEPLPLLDKLTDVDCAELVALLAAIPEGAFLSSPAGAVAGGGGASEGRGRPSGRISAALFGSDALQVALLVARQGTQTNCSAELLDRLVSAVRSSSRRFEPSEEDLPAVLEPPPLRSGGWFELAPPDTPDVAPSESDIRWTRILFRGRGAPERDPHGQRKGRAAPPPDAPEWVLLRLRVTLRGDGEPLLLPVASECWEVSTTDSARDESAEGIVEARIWRLDRSELLRGRDPWVLVAGEQPARAPERAGISSEGDDRQGHLVAASFRQAGAREAVREGQVIPYRSILILQWRDQARERVRRVIERALGPKITARGSSAADRLPISSSSQHACRPGLLLKGNMQARMLAESSCGEP